MRIIPDEAIRDAVGRNSRDIVEWTKQLIRFPSDNRPPKGQEAGVQTFIAQECRAEGLAVDVFAPEEVSGIQDHPTWLNGREYDAGRANVVATWGGGGKGRSLLLSGHSDVAPFEPDNWHVCRPYEPVEESGRLYGRGSADMKAGLAAAFWAVKILRLLDFQPTGNVIFESVVDEEFASGNGTLAARLRGHNADFAVVGEPTRMQICPACFGAFLGDLTLRGKAGMPYMGKSIANPIHGAARIAELFASWEDSWRKEHHHPLFMGPGKELNVLPWIVDSTTPGEFTQMGTPGQVKISWIVWCHPGMSEEEFFSRFRSYWSEHAANDARLQPFELELEQTYHYVKPWETPVTHAGVKAASEAFSIIGREAPIEGAPFSCDLGVYGEVGKMPCVLLGPGGDNLHAPDEWVKIEDILSLTMVYARLAASWCG